MGATKELRPVGIIGGLSWESSAEYYRIMNREVALRRGGLSSARILMSSVDFSFYADAMACGRWEDIRSALTAEALRLRRAGAEALVIATNTMHRFAAELEAATDLPVLHIADATARAILTDAETRGGRGDASRGAGKARVVGLMGTRYTMEGDFYVKRLADRFGMETLVPPEAERAEINRIIFQELCRGEFKEESREKLLAYAAALAERGAGDIILGCTELPLVMKEGDGPVPFRDTTTLHALAAVDFMLGESAEDAAAVDAAVPAAPEPAALWAEFLESLPEGARERAEKRGYTAWHFCADKENADELGALARAGVKRATASSLRAYQATGERLPEPGDYSVVTDWEGRPLCLIETTRLEIVPFDRVTAEFAAREGEGDGSLRFWREGHERYFRAEHAALDLPFDENIPVLCEEFEVRLPAAASPAAAEPAARGPAAYFVADIRIKDEGEYGRYLDRVDGVSARFEGEYLAVDAGPKRLEGERAHGRLVIIRFPDEAALRRWYDSPEYQAILPLRLGAAECDSVIVRGKA